jgi:hypothetical protein
MTRYTSPNKLSEIDLSGSPTASQPPIFTRHSDVNLILSNTSAYRHVDNPNVSGDLLTRSAARKNVPRLSEPSFLEGR